MGVGPGSRRAWSGRNKGCRAAGRGGADPRGGGKQTEPERGWGKGPRQKPREKETERVQPHRPRQPAGPSSRAHRPLCVGVNASRSPEWWVDVGSSVCQLWWLKPGGRSRISSGTRRATAGGRCLDGGCARWGCPGVEEVPGSRRGTPGREGEGQGRGPPAGALRTQARARAEPRLGRRASATAEPADVGRLLEASRGPTASASAGRSTLAADARPSSSSTSPPAAAPVPRGPRRGHGPWAAAGHGRDRPSPVAVPRRPVCTDALAPYDRQGNESRRTAATSRAISEPRV